MATTVILPKVGMSMTTGVLSAWIAQDGSEVREGEPLFLLETEKVSMEVLAEASGRLHTLAEQGADLEPGSVVGWLLAPGEDSPRADVADISGADNGSRPERTDTAPEPAPMATTRTGRTLATPIARRLARERGIELGDLIGSGPGGRIQERDVVARPDAGSAPESSDSSDDRGLFASPVALGLAEMLGLELDTITGSGPDGRVSRRDVLAHARSIIAGTRAGDAPASVLPAAALPARERTLSPMRRVIGRRMTESLREAPQLTVGRSIDVQECVNLLPQLQQAWGDQSRPTLLMFVLSAFSRALRANPEALARIDSASDPSTLTLPVEINIGVAVAVDGGLLVPVVRSTDTRSLRELADETARLAAAARAGTLRPHETDGAGATVSSLGGVGVEWFTPILNPPETVILGVGRSTDGVRWEGDVPRRRAMLPLSLTFDHRVIDGYPAAVLLNDVAALLAAPLKMMT